MTNNYIKKILPFFIIFFVIIGFYGSIYSLVFSKKIYEQTINLINLEKDEKTTLILQEEFYTEILGNFDAKSILIYYVGYENTSFKDSEFHLGFLEKNKSSCYYSFLGNPLNTVSDLYCVVRSNFLDNGYIKLLKDNGKWTAYMPKNRFEQKHEHYQSVIDDALLMIKYKKTW